MEIRPGVLVDSDRLKTICPEHGITKLSLFGSALRDDFNDSSDVDMLVEFSADRPVGFLEIAEIEFEIRACAGRHSAWIPTITPVNQFGCYQEDKGEAELCKSLA